MDKDDVKQIILEIADEIVGAQLRAIRRLRGKSKEERPRRRGRSQVDIAYDILKEAGRPLHVSEIIDRAEKVHGAKVDRESIVSSLTKKVARGDRFIRTERNTFGLKGRDERC